MKRIFEGKHVLVLERDGWEFVERRSAREAVAVVAETTAGEVILTEQYRRPVDARVIDLPAGLLGDEDDGDDPARTAVRELEEETGFTCDSVDLIARGVTSPGITSERVSLFRARGVRRIGEGGGVGGEEIAVHLVPRSALGRWLAEKERDGALVDLKVLAAFGAAAEDGGGGR